MSELAYLAGIFDGEGSFGNWSKGKDKSREFRASVEMSDGDVILRFLKYFQKGTITALPPRKEGYKTIYHWRVRSDQGKDVVRLMLPYLSKRRQAKFHEVE
jgi:hypothetical protein